jgi:hypothetical protein
MAVSFSGYSQVTEFFASSTDMKAFERPDQTVVVVSQSSTSIRINVWSPVTGWGSAVIVNTAPAETTPGRSLAADMDANGDIMITWSSASKTYGRILRADGSFSTELFIVASKNDAPNSEVISTGAGKWTAATFSTGGNANIIQFTDFDDATGNWVNTRTVVDRSTPSTTQISKLSLCHDTAGDIHLLWSETIAPDEKIWSQAGEGGSPVLREDLTGVGTTVSRTPRIVAHPTSLKVMALWYVSVGAGTDYIKYEVWDGSWGGSTTLVTSDLDVTTKGHWATVDIYGNVHLIYTDTTATNLLHYRRSLGMSGGGTGQAWTTAVRWNTSTPPFPDFVDAVVSYASSTGNVLCFSNSGAQTWWNVCAECAEPPSTKKSGTSLRVALPAAIEASVDHLKLDLGEIPTFGGGPLATGPNTAVAGDKVVIDTAMQIRAKGTLNRWGFATDDAVHNRHEPGTVVLIIARDAGGGTYTVIHAIGNDVAIPAATAAGRQVYLFSIPGGIAVLRNDIVGMWMPATLSSTILMCGTAGGVTGTVKSFTYATPPPPATVMSSPSDTADGMLAVFAFGEPINPVPVLQGFVSDGTDELATESFVDWAQATPFYLPDANIINPNNATDTSAVTFAHVVLATIGYMYFSVDFIAGDTTPIQAIDIAMDNGLPAGTTVIEVAVSQADVTKDLAGAQAITEAEWIKSFELNDTNYNPGIAGTLSHSFPIAQRGRWVRVKIDATSSAANVEINNVGIEIATLEVLDGEFPKHPTATKLTRIWLDKNSHRHAPQNSSTILNSVLSATNTKMTLAALAAENDFWDQWLPGDTVWALKGVRGDVDRSAKAVVKSVGVGGAQFMEITTGFGVEFTIGDKIAPPMLAVKVTPTDASGNPLYRGKWCPIAGTVEEYFARRNTYAGET